MFKFLKSEADKSAELFKKWESESKAFAIKEFKEGIAKGEKALLDVGLALDGDALSVLMTLKAKLEAEAAALNIEVQP